MYEDELIHFIWLTENSACGSKDVIKLIEHFGGPENVFSAETPELVSVIGSNSSLLKKLEPHDISRACAIVRTCEEKGIDIVPYYSERYPKRLKGIYKMPLVLYTRGKIPDYENRMSVAFVGTRKITNYATSVAPRMIQRMCEANAVIVSGGAYGVDSLANGLACYGGWDTIVVLGCGVDVAYPAENVRLFEQIAEKGMLVSEYPPGTGVTRFRFPERNRIISGLSDAVVVVEASLGSGALITAECAEEQHRKLYAIPGFLTAQQSQGADQLLRDGASALVSPENIIDDFAERFPHLRINPDGKSFRAHTPTIEARDVYNFIAGKVVDLKERMKRGAQPLSPELSPRRADTGINPNRSNGVKHQRVIRDSHGAPLQKKNADIAEPTPKNETNTAEPTQKQDTNASESARKQDTGTAPMKRRDTSTVASESVKAVSEKPVTESPDEKFEAESLHDEDAPDMSALDEAQRKVLSRIPVDAPVTTDSICGEDLDVRDVSSALTKLEILGFIKSCEGDRWARSKGK